MKRKLWLILGAVAVVSTAAQVQAVQFFSDNFDGYAAEIDLFNAGWTRAEVNAPLETGSIWTLNNPGGRANPPTIDGTPSTGKFLISDSDWSDFSDTVDSGMSHDIISPRITTTGAATVWLHMDVSAQLNNNGAAVFDIDISRNNGGTWTNAFRRVSPRRVASNGATTVLPDTTNVDGYYGRLDLDVSALGGNAAAMKFRVRHYEPNDDWWIAFDNVVVDDVAVVGGGTTIFAEDFNSYTLGAMLVDGLNTGTETWTTADKGNRYTSGAFDAHDGRSVGRLMQPNAEGANGEVQFAIMDSDADPDPAENEFLMTPLLDLSAMSEVFLHYKSEVVAASAERVLLMQDSNGNNMPDMGDAVLSTIFNYAGGGLRDGGEEPYFADRLFDVSAAAAGLNDVFFAWQYEGAGDSWWWAVDDVMVTGNPVPEPSTLVLLGLGVVGAALLRRRARG